MSVKTNDLKKGTHVQLRNGMQAKIEDNMKGNTRLCTVYGEDVGMFTEMGSVYSHDIIAVLAGRHGEIVETVEHTAKQKDLRRTVGAWGF